jgi:hypothetical protein
MAGAATVNFLAALVCAPPEQGDWLGIRVQLVWRYCPVCLVPASNRFFATFGLRIVATFNSIRWALWMMRSRIASAIVDDSPQVAGRGRPARPQVKAIPFYITDVSATSARRSMKRRLATT